MISAAYPDLSPKKGLKSKAKLDDEVDRLIDEAAMQFARLFLDQCMYAKRPQDRDIPSIDCSAPL